MQKSLLYTLLLVSIVSNAQNWSIKATGFTTSSRSLNKISIANANVIWANAFDNSVPLNPKQNVKEITLSIDGGNTWTPKTVNLGADNTLLGISSISAISDKIAWISVYPETGGTGGIWKTIDGGTSWSKQTTAPFNAAKSYPNFVHFWDANNGVAQGDPEGGEFEIYTTTNGGTNWTKVPGTNIPDPTILGEAGYFKQYCISGNTIWFGTDKGRIFKSTDKGINWTANTSPSADFGLDNFTFSDTNKGLLLTYNPVKLYKTTDGGVSWNTTPIPYTGQVFNTNITYVPGTSKVISSAYANPLGSSYSLDDGASWTTIDSGVFHGDLAFLNSGFGFSAGLNSSSTVGGISKFSGTLFVEKFDLTNQITAYPNPTNGILNLNSESSIIKQASVFDLSGKQVYSSKFSGTNNVTLDLKSVQTGVYFLKTTTDSGKTETITILKK